MSDPGGLGMTYGDLLLAAARALECEHTDEDGEPVIPPLDTARTERRLCETVVKRAVRWLVGQKPDWPWLRQTATVTFASGTAAYDMPWWFSGMVFGPWVYTATGPASCISIVGNHELDAARNGYPDTSTGEPTLCTFRVKDAVIGAEQQPRRYEAVFWPTPGNTFTVTINARAYPEAMDDPNQRFFGGEEVNAALEAAVMYEGAYERSPDKLPQAMQRRTECLGLALAQAGAAAPRDQGRLAPTMGIAGRNGFSDGNWDRSNGLTYYNGTLVT